MLKLLLIVFVVALALAPLAHFVPSKRQRHIARLREYAAVHGLFVEFRQIPHGERLIRSRQIRAGDVIYYGKRLAPARGEPLGPASWIHHEDGWRGNGKYLPTPAALEQFSNDVLAASVDESSCGVYWTESIAGATDEEAATSTVEQIRTALEAWAGELIG